MEITLAEYINARKIITLYNQQEKTRPGNKDVLVNIQNELKEYFKNNKVSGETILLFSLENYSNDPKYLILNFNSPLFDEDYHDDKADIDIEEIGKNYEYFIRVNSSYRPK